MSSFIAAVPSRFFTFDIESRATFSLLVFFRTEPTNWNDGEKNVAVSTFIIISERVRRKWTSPSTHATSISYPKSNGDVAKQHDDAFDHDWFERTNKLKDTCSNEFIVQVQISQSSTRAVRKWFAFLSVFGSFNNVSVVEELRRPSCRRKYRSLFRHWLVKVPFDSLLPMIVHRPARNRRRPVIRRLFRAHRANSSHRSRRSIIENSDFRLRRQQATRRCSSIGMVFEKSAKTRTQRRVIWRNPIWKWNWNNRNGTEKKRVNYWISCTRITMNY